MGTLNRKTFIKQAGLLGSGLMLAPALFSVSKYNFHYTPLSVGKPSVGEDVFKYITRIRKKFDLGTYRGILGAANYFKEGDVIASIAAVDESSRQHARTLLSNTRIGDIKAHAVYDDNQYQWIRASVVANTELEQWTMNDLKQFILSRDEQAIKTLIPSLESDVISILVKLMTNEELIAASSKIFNPLPGSNIGSKGYLSARVQPNSPTDDPEDIVWQVFDAWSYAVGDLLLGCNPVSSDVKSVAKIEQALYDIRKTFQLEDALAHSVLAHIDVQAEVEKLHPGTTGVWFQSIAGTDTANTTFNLSIKTLKNHLKSRQGKYGLYAETGQGADGTNGHSEGFDMVMHEARKYGLIRCLKQYLTEHNNDVEPWVFVNDVAGFIGPEVFKTREQLVRCCLEDTLMGKLHGMCIGLDVCTTLHMDVTLDDLDWCIDQIMPANPAYLMALPTKNDPMLSYLTTSFSNHLKVREKYGYKVNDVMWDFFKRIEVIDENGQPGRHFGDPIWVYYQYKKLKGDTREQALIYEEGRMAIDRVIKRGVPIAEGYGATHSDIAPALDKEIRVLYEDAKSCLWSETDKSFITSLNADVLQSMAFDKLDYINHPMQGEQLDTASLATLSKIIKNRSVKPHVQIIISDGLNARALMDDGHLSPFLQAMNQGLKDAGMSVATKNIFVKYGRVRVGYRIGEQLFKGNSKEERIILHVIGERPGNGHRTFSVYITKLSEQDWKSGGVDHNVTRVVSGIADTALLPISAADMVIDILK